VEGAEVPETAIDEYCNLATLKDDVGLASNARYDCQIHPEAETARMEAAPKCYFWIGIPLTRSLHPL
jgi:hypothetical protein